MFDEDVVGETRVGAERIEGIVGGGKGFGVGHLAGSDVGGAFHPDLAPAVSPHLGELAHIAAIGLNDAEGPWSSLVHTLAQGGERALVVDEAGGGKDRGGPLGAHVAVGFGGAAFDAMQMGGDNEGYQAVAQFDVGGGGVEVSRLSRRRRQWCHGSGGDSGGDIAFADVTAENLQPRIGATFHRR